MRAIIKAAFKSDELQQQLEEVIAVDENRCVAEFSDELIITEARYVLDKFTGGIGFEQEDDYLGHNGPEMRTWARKNVHALKSFLKKYPGAV